MRYYPEKYKQKDIDAFYERIKDQNILDVIKSSLRNISFKKPDGKCNHEICAAKATLRGLERLLDKDYANIHSFRDLRDQEPSMFIDAIKYAYVANY